jgi:hypothetical protein
MFTKAILKYLYNFNYIYSQLNISTLQLQNKTTTLSKNKKQKNTPNLPQKNYPTTQRKTNNNKTTFFKIKKQN